MNTLITNIQSYSNRMQLALSVLSFILTWLILSVLVNNALLGGMVCFSLLVHEVGHQIAFLVYGIQSKIYSGVIFAKCIPNKNHYPIVNALSAVPTAIVYLSGPLANFILMLICLWITKNDPSSEWGVLATINAGMVVENLLPILPNYDGSKILGLIQSSLTPQKNRKVIFGIVLAVLLCSAVMDMAGKPSFVITIFAVMILINSLNYQPSPGPRMSVHDGTTTTGMILLAIAYGGMYIASAIVFSDKYMDLMIYVLRSALIR